MSAALRQENALHGCLRSCSRPLRLYLAAAARSFKRHQRVDIGAERIKPRRRVLPSLTSEHLYEGGDKEVRLKPVWWSYIRPRRQRSTVHIWANAYRAGSEAMDLQKRKVAAKGVGKSARAHRRHGGDS